MSRESDERAALQPPTELVERLRSAQRVVLTSHVSPDGDAIGSELGFARLLRGLGIEVVVWNRDHAPRVYAPLPDSAGIHVGEEPPAGFPEAFDLAVTLECPSLDRCGLEARITELPLINIDHHLGNDGYGEIAWVDPDAPAVGAMVYRLAQALGASIDGETATALYPTLVTDTGGFRFPNATAEAFDTAAALVREGAEPDRVAHWLYESQPEAAVRLLGEVLQSLELHHDGRVATVWLTRAMSQRAGARPGDSEGLIDHPRSIAGVDAVALFREIDDATVKVSLRSRGAADVQAIARSLGGGGHQNAAGCTVELETGAPPGTSDFPSDHPTLQRHVVAALVRALTATS
ncbi:MAG: bifunctional oligoribonuclease/PAP phosphatase NrnA [Acidobacteriota bacterium]